MKKGLFRDTFQFNFRLTIAVYLFFFLALLVLIGYVGRHIIFRSWTSRNMVATAVVDDKIYCFGGQGENNTYFRDILQIDLDKKLIKQLNDLPHNTIGLKSVSHKGIIYLIGGVNGTDFSDKILRFDPNSGELENFAKMPYPIAFGGAATIGDAIFYMGGWTGDHLTNEIIKIDIPGGSVKAIGKLPSPLEYFGLVANQDKLYLIGGEDQNGQVLDDILEIDPQTAQVLRTSKLPSARMYIEAIACEERIYLTGGWADGATHNSILSLDPSNLRIENTGLTLNKRKILYHSLAIVKNQLYLIGGADVHSQRQIGVFEIDPAFRSISSPRLDAYSWM